MTSRGNWFWLVPAVAFLLGLVLGGVLVAVGGWGDGDGSAADGETKVSTPTPTTSTPRDDLTVTVAGACLDAVDATEQVVTLGRQAVSALTELDARELQRVVNEMQQLEMEVRDLAEQCRDASSDTR